MLAALQGKGRNIITLEDPVEYEMPGINQVQINERTGLTFARGLRSILRQDPDIIMVGEIRDQESAEIAIRLAYTGHLVLASLHTGHALGAVERMVEMGIASHLLASCLNGVIAQRLVRCSRDGSIPGRIAIQEVMICDDKIRQMISSYETFVNQREMIAKQFSSLAEDGRKKMQEGKTVQEELMAVLGPEV
jgi:type II secretory ATPase GspE/PulE/Tfp pilus assembly ATPase PilB-like protein